ncbi:FtsK/SpoIIIE domain-containing protein [Streptomyces sp. NPDC002835]
MQIRLTVLAPRGGQSAPAGRPCDVIVTAPAGTALAAVASGLAAAVSGTDVSGTVVLYAGQERLDLQRRTLGEPPLVDGAVLALQTPADDEPHGSDVPAQLHVVAGPDAGGVHLLHGGRISIGRSADADVPLDDPDVSRLHCAVTVADDGRVTVTDLGSTNGTTVDGASVGSRPVRLPTGALLRLGESTLRLAPGAGPPALPTTPDGEGHLRIPGGSVAAEPDDAPVPPESSRYRPVAGASGGSAPGPSWADPGPARPAVAPDAAHRPHAGGTTGPDGAARVTTAGGPAPGGAYDAGSQGGTGHEPNRSEQTHHFDAAAARVPAQYVPEGGTPVTGPEADAPGRRRRGIGTWARRLAGGRGGPVVEETGPAGPVAAAAPPTVASWPDPAAVLLTALGPGHRLWERGPDHPESLVLRLGTADRAELPSVAVTVALKEAGSLGLAGPRARLAGLARSAVAQLAALHSPSDLEIVLISADRTRRVEERTAEWAWLGWLPHLRPAHGQDCRLLLAYDHDQATARAAELSRRLDEGPLGPGWPSADGRAVTAAADRHGGPRTVVIVDGDPGSAALRETTARLAGAGRAAGIHLICLAETAAASPLSPVAVTYESACAVSLPFRECGAAALLTGDVATALRLMRVAGGQPAGHGTVGVVDAVSAAWAERFGRALAPLRAEGSSVHPGRVAVLPRSARLLDELELARATPASLMARWASACDGTVVLGAGPRGPLTVDLAEEGPHLLIEGPAGSGRTELLRSVAASLAAAGRPDRLGLLLVDGAGGERGDGLTACTELPHVTEHLVASDPVRMRSFAQALGAELKRRAAALDEAGVADFTEWRTRREVAERMVGQRPPSAAEQRGDLDSPSSGTLRLRPGGRTRSREPDPLPRLVVLVDDFDALVAPALGSPGRPAAGSVVRALEAVARDGGRLGIHLVATSSRPDRTADTQLAEGARLRVVLEAPPVAPGPDDPAPGRGRLGHPDGRVTAFQSGRVTGRIPRTATSRPTVVPLEWERMGDPPTRRPLRELGNGPTDLALLASALERAAQSVDASPVPPLAPAHP